MDRPGIARKLPRRTDTSETQVGRAVVKYAFVGLSARAGATTLSFAFADWLARSASHTGSVALVEISDDYPQSGGSDYDRVGVDVRFAGREYVSV
jgi:hypothetical protein